MSGHEWYYNAETAWATVEERGPIQETELLALARDGKIKRETLVRSPTRTKGAWHSVASIPGIVKLIDQGERERQVAREEAEQERRAQRERQTAERSLARQQALAIRAQEAEEFSRISECQNIELVRTIRDRVMGIITATEMLNCIVVQQKPIVNISPDAIVVTDRRLIFYRPKLLGRFEFEDFMWLDVFNAHLQQNLLGSVFSAQHVSGRWLTMDYLPKSAAQTLYRIAQEREEQARINRRNLELEKARAGAAQINVQTNVAAPAAPVQAQVVQQSPEDPMKRLQKLKALADAGLISPTEFDERKRQILSEI